MSIVVAILVLSLLVFFHELGHFIVARICGVGVEVFSVGFGRKLAGVKIRGTEYRISLIPLGGYVKLLEEDGNSSLGNHSHNPYTPASLRRMSNTPQSQGEAIAQSNTANTRIVCGEIRDSKINSESTTSDSHSISESASPVIASNAKQSTESTPHASLESLTDSEVRAERHSLSAIESSFSSKRCAEQALKASSGWGIVKGEGATSQFKPLPLNKKEKTESEEVKKTLEVKAGDSETIDSESEKQIESTRVRDSTKWDLESKKIESATDSESERAISADSQSIDCHDFASATSHNDTKTESNPHASTKSPTDSRNISAQAKCAPYTSKPPLTRIAILLAGPAFNFLLAFLLYLAVGAGGVMSLLPVVGEVKPHSAAARAGVQKGDVIESINGAPLRTWAELDRAIVDSKGALELSIRRGGQSLSLSLTPEISEARNAFNERITRKMIGIASAGVVGEVAYRGLDVLRYACAESLSAATLIAQGFVKLVSGVVPSSELGGVVSIVSVIGGASEYSLTRLLWLTALISVNLGVLNLLPIPALDGGHIVFNLYELITRKAPNERVMHYLTLCGWAILLSLMFLGLYNDIFRLLG